MVRTSFWVGLCLAIASGAAALEPITEQDLQQPSFFEQQVKSLQNQRTHAKIAIPLVVGCVSAYLLWSCRQPVVEATPSGSFDLYTRIKHAIKTATSYKTASWGQMFANYLCFTAHLTLGSLAALVIGKPFDLVPFNRGLLYRFPSWETYDQYRWSTTHLDMLQQIVTAKNAAPLPETTALFTESSKQIIIDARYIASHLSTQQAMTKHTLASAAQILLELTNQLIGQVTNKTIVWKSIEETLTGLQACLTTIAGSADKANTMLSATELVSL